MKRSPWMLSLRIRGRVSPVFARSRVHAQVFAKRAPKGGEQEDVRIVKAQGDLDGAGVRLLEQLPQQLIISCTARLLRPSSSHERATSPFTLFKEKRAMAVSVCYSRSRLAELGSSSWRTPHERCPTPFPRQTSSTPSVVWKFPALPLPFRTALTCPMQTFTFDLLFFPYGTHKWAVKIS